MNFASELSAAIGMNESVHDGAIMFGRTVETDEYTIQGWSYRLSPPDIIGMPVNRGSAYNSCLAMSAVNGVDALVLVNRVSTTQFIGGVAIDPLMIERFDLANR